jgi:RNA polymerase sigma-70 factor (ECF subfamily)
VKRENKLKEMKNTAKEYKKIYLKNFEGLWRYVLSRVRNKEVAEDIVSESFIALFDNLKNIVHKEAIRAYLYRIAQNKIVDSYRNKKEISMNSDYFDNISEMKNEKSKTNIGSLEAKTERVLCALPQSYQEVLRLRYLSGLKLSEVATLLNKSLGNIKVIQNRALKKAKQIAINNLLLK